MCLTARTLECKQKTSTYPTRLEIPVLTVLLGEHINTQLLDTLYTISCETAYCITLYFRGRKISRKVNLKYFREKIFSRIYCSRENIFPRKYLLAKIFSRENIFPRKYPPAKIVCLFRQRSFLFAVCCPVAGLTLDPEFASHRRKNKSGLFDHVTNARYTDN